MPSGRTQKLSVLALAKPYFCCCEGFRMLWHFSDLAPSEAQVRDTPMAGYRTCRTPNQRAAQISLAATASIARLALCIAAWSCAFPRQIDPTGKSFRVFRNRVKPKNQKYFAFAAGQIRGTSIAIL